MRKKSTAFRNLFFGSALVSFTLGLAWHFSKTGNEKIDSALELAQKPSGSGVAVFETAEPTLEDNAPLPDISSEELAFRERAERVLADFPQKHLLKDPNRDLHRPPPELADAGAELGAIEDLLDDYPDLINEGLRFYKKCALKDELLTSLRALCLHNLKNRAKKTGKEASIRWSEFPDQLHRLADRL